MTTIDGRRVRRTSSRRARRVLIAAAVIATLGGAMMSPAMAQVPQPAWYMYNTYPQNPFPPKAPGFTFTANAVVVEGVGGINCFASENDIKWATVAFLNQAIQTVTEISPQSACGTIAQYKTMIQNIINYVETYAGNPGRYWGGIMLDEEPGFGFSIAQLKDLNDFTTSAFYPTPGMSWVFTENQPNGWLVADYHYIGVGTYAAPQVYTQSMASAVNTECTQYIQCLNLVTVNAVFPAPWNNYVYVTNLINVCHGTICQEPWSSSFWGSLSWVNMWKPG